MHILFTVPSPVVEVTNIDSVEFGETTTLECNVIAVRGITSSVNIGWITLTSPYNYTTVKTAEDVTANIVNNSAIYTDQLITPPLSYNDSGRVYYCVVVINTTFGLTYYGSIVLDIDGKLCNVLYITHKIHTSCF